MGYCTMTSYCCTTKNAQTGWTAGVGPTTGPSKVNGAVPVRHGRPGSQGPRHSGARRERSQRSVAQLLVLIRVRLEMAHAAAEGIWPPPVVRCA